MSIKSHEICDVIVSETRVYFVIKLIASALKTRALNLP